jgi:hypothetical protein
MRVRPLLITTLIAAALLAVPTAAHHSISAEFDTNKQVTLNGIVTNVDWMNPHTYVFVDVKDPAVSKTRTWACELASPNELARRGFTRGSLKVGMVVRVIGTRAKDGSFRIHTETLADDNGVILGKGPLVRG